MTFSRVGWSFKPISCEPEMTIACTSEPSFERGWLIRSPCHFGDGISRLLETSISLPLPSSKVMNQIRHPVLFLFFFLVRGTAGYWRDPHNEILRPCSSNFLSPERPFLFLRCLGGRTGTLSCQGRTLQTTSPLNLPERLGGRARILTSRGRLPGLNADRQLSTGILGLRFPG